jgi:hypothetical protein
MAYLETASPETADASNKMERQFELEEVTKRAKEVTTPVHMVARLRATFMRGMSFRKPMEGDRGEARRASVKWPWEVRTNRKSTSKPCQASAVPMRTCS